MKLSSSVLRRIIAEEAAKFKRDTPEAAAKDTEEVEADEYADTVPDAKDWSKENKLKTEAHVDMIMALKVEENRLVRRLKKIREEKSIVAKRIAGITK